MSIDLIKSMISHRKHNPNFFQLLLHAIYTVRKDPLNDPDALMFLKNVLKFGLKNSEE